MKHEIPRILAHRGYFTTTNHPVQVLQAIRDSK